MRTLLSYNSLALGEGEQLAQGAGF
jgi:hypothetical protein